MVAMTAPDPVRNPVARWWHGLRPATRRATRQTLAVLAAGVCAFLFGLLTASADGAVGPHEARLSTTVDHQVVIDLGPLGSVILDSPAPWPLGVHVDVGEIPATLTEIDDPLASLGGDVAAYAQFFSDPASSVRTSLLALGADVARRTFLAWSIAVVLLAAGRLAAGGLLRDEVRRKLSQPAVATLVVVSVLAVVAVPVVGAVTAPEPAGRPSEVLADLGGPLAGARVTGRLGGLVDTYGEMALDAVRANEAYYDVMVANAAAAYAADPEPLAPDVLPGPVAVEPGDGEQTDAQAGDGGPSDAQAGDGGQSDAQAGDGEQSNAQATDDATDGSTPTPSASPTPAEPDIVTAMIVSDNHCNTGATRVFGEIGRQAEADVVLNLGDTTLGGSSVESICVNQMADALKGFPVVVADGNHDSAETGRQEAARGWTVLDGGVVEVEGLRIVGDRDPRLTSVTLGNTEFRTKTDAAQALTDAACPGVDPDDPSTRVDILAIHDPYVGNRVMPSGCVVLELSGHLHRRIGPIQQGLGLLYVNGSSGGAKEGTVPVGQLEAPGYVSVLLYDRANHRPVALREIVLGTDQSVTLGEWEPFPEPPTTSVDADLSVAANPRP